MDAPEVRYAQSGAVNIAYQVVGDGPVDLLYVPGWISHLDLYWEDPIVARFLRRLATGFRLVVFDRRGTGLSDRVPEDELPTLEGRMDDARAVLDAAGNEQAVIFAQGYGTPLAIVFAATYPSERGRSSSTTRWPRLAERPRTTRGARLLRRKRPSGRGPSSNGAARVSPASGCSDSRRAQPVTLGRSTGTHG